MCGRFTLRREAAAIELFLGQSFGDLGLSRPRFNIAPSQGVMALIGDDVPHIETLRWGLIPFWAKDPSIGSRMINARAETVAEKPSFRSAFRSQRCLVFADGFYEWKRKTAQTPALPYYFQRSEGSLFAFAGLWDRWQKGDQAPIYSCTIITCQPNNVVEPIHNRMPVILDETMCWAWLQEDDSGMLSGMLKPYPGEEMTAQRVSTLVNSPMNDSPECVIPLEASGDIEESLSMS